MSSESSSPTSTTSCLPIRRTPAIACPSIACSGGSKVFSALMPGASEDSIAAPASASSSRRAVISTSGSSGTQPLQLPRPQQRDELGVADAGNAALLEVDPRAGHVEDDLGEVRVVAHDEDARVLRA